jgi:putative Mn2+ efflux pump MntP
MELNEVSMRLAEKMSLMWTNILTVSGIIVANASHQAITTYLTWISLIVLILLNASKLFNAVDEWKKKQKEKHQEPTP